MRKTLTILATFVLAFAIGLGSTVFLAGTADAKPTQCRLTVEPFLYCVDHPACKDGTQRCWECQGYDLSGEPCLCTFLGCQ